MIEVRIADRTPTEIMELVRELREQGLLQGKDFDFTYNPGVWDNITGHPVSEKYTLFTFYVEKYATFFILKYVK